MTLHWTIQISSTFRIMIATLLVLPVILIMTSVMPLIQLILGIAALLLFSMIIRVTNVKKHSKLSWQDGVWYFRSEKYFLKGTKNVKSFTFGWLIYLVIEDEQANDINLWLFPDSLHSFNEQPTAAWRSLLCCFYLTD